MLEQWIKDFEAKFDNHEKRAYLPTKFLYDLRNKSMCLGVEELKTESGTKERIYCHILSNKQGVIIEREKSDERQKSEIGPITSYGNISLEDFVREHTPFNPQKESRIKKYFLPAFIGTIIPVTYLGLKKLFSRKEDGG